MVLLLQFTRVSLLLFFRCRLQQPCCPSSWKMFHDAQLSPIGESVTCLLVSGIPGTWVTLPTSKQQKIHSKPGFSVKFWVESKIRYSVSACISHAAKSKSTATVTCSGDISPTAVLTTISCQCRNLSWRVPWQQGDSLLVQRYQKRQKSSNFGSCLLERSL